jgi:hypothetical protein
MLLLACGRAAEGITVDAVAPAERLGTDIEADFPRG